MLEHVVDVPDWKRKSLPSMPANRCVVTTMNESGRRRWCLYLPGFCLHAVPVAPGRHEQLHVQHPRLSHGFKYYPIKIRSPAEPTLKQGEVLQYIEIPPFLYPDVHPALQRPSSPPTLPREEPLIPFLYTDVLPLVYPRLRGSLTRSFTPELPVETLRRSRLPLPKSSLKKPRPFQRRPIPDYTPPNMPAMHSEAFTPDTRTPDFAALGKLTFYDDKAFENTSTSVAASQMRNALNQLADTVKDPEEKKVRI
jgi:UTP--glucose-1-phosphate uridylyltransferase